MTAELNPLTEVRLLADAIFDGKLDATGVARLENLLESSQECLHAYVERLDYHGELLDQADPHSNEQAALLVLQDIADERYTRSSASQRNVVIACLTTAATVCGLMFLLFVGKPIQVVPLGSIAHLSNNVASSVEEFDLAKIIHSGQTVSIDRGVLSIELGDVMIDLQGPALLKVISLKEVELHHGMLNARVGKGGTGFTVRTPDAEVVDYGTEFCVRCSESSGTDVTVRQGTVRTRLLGVEESMMKSLELTTQRTAHLDHQNAVLSEVAYDPLVYRQIDQTKGRIRTITGQLRTATAPPVTLLSEREKTPNHILIIPERQGVLLDHDLDVVTRTGPLRIPAGKTVSSYLVHYDPTTSAAFAPRGSIRFYGKIAGVIVGSKELKATDQILGLPDTSYERQDFRGLELDADELRTTPEGDTVSFFFRMEAPHFQDQARILVVHD